MTDSPVLLLSEIFGPTIQGEGPDTGRRAMFLRLGLCNLDCSWCDTPYTWDWTGKNGPKQDKDALFHLPTTEVLAKLREPSIPVGLVVVTGGEPMLQATRLWPLLRALDDLGVDVNIETNGTIGSSALEGAQRLRFVVSPKLAHSGVDPAHAAGAMANYAPVPSAVFKFVASTWSDFDEIAELTADVDPSRVWVMPQGVDAVDVLTDGRLMADRVIERGWNVSTRLHTLLWGNERGR